MICRDGLMMDCPCTAGCARHGVCSECVAHHAGKGNLPVCLRLLKPALKERRREEKRLEKEKKKTEKIGR
jgi:hypothetical protein